MHFLFHSNQNRLGLHIFYSYDLDSTYYCIKCICDEYYILLRLALSLVLVESRKLGISGVIKLLT